MRRTISILLTGILLCAVLFSGCSSSGSTKNLMTFPWGCTVEETADYFGVSMEDVTSQDQGTTTAGYSFVMTYNGVDCVVYFISYTPNGSIGVPGVHDIMVRFAGADQETAEQYFEQQLGFVSDAQQQSEHTYLCADGTVYANYRTFQLPDEDEPTMVTCDFYSAELANVTTDAE